jgi:hypothetical protein
MAAVVVVVTVQKKGPVKSKRETTDSSVKTERINR